MFKNQEQKKSSQVIITSKKIETSRNFDKKKITLDQELAFQKLIKSIKNSSKKINEELERFDIDTDNKLTRYEFTQFLNLYLQKPVRIYNLIDFFDLNKKYNDILINDFLSVLEKRTLENQKQEKQLFIILLKRLKNQGMTPKNFLQKFDIQKYDNDSNKELNINEFKGFLEDINSNQEMSDDNIRRLFSYIDEDDSGEISLDEFQNKLQTVQILYDLQTGDLKKKNDTKNKQIIQVKKFNLKNEIEEQIEDDNIDLNKPILGEIKIQCLNLKLNQNSNQEIQGIKLRLPGLTKNWVGKNIDSENIDLFKYACRIPIRKQFVKNINDEIIFCLFSSTENLGQLKVKWKKILSTPDQWSINQEYFFDNGASITIQLKFLHKDNLEIDSQNSKKSFKIQKDLSGKINLNLIDLSYINNIYLNDYQNIFCQIILPNNTKHVIECNVQDSKLIFNKQISEKIFFKENQMVNFIRVRIYQKKGVLSQKKLLGETYIDFQEALNFPGTKMQNSIFILQQNEKDTSQILQLSINFDMNTNQISQIIKGKLKIIIQRAKNLKMPGNSFFNKNDIIDPYFKLLMNLNAEKQLNYKTKIIKNNTNPNYEEETMFSIELPQSKDIQNNLQILPNIQVQMWDDELLKDDQISEVLINWQEAFQNPGKWAINQYFEMKNKKGEYYGEIYISLNYIPEGFLDRQITCIDIDPKIGKDISEKKIEGKLELKILFLNDLKLINPETKILQKNIELKPYVKITMPNEKQYETKSYQKNQNIEDIDFYPINETFQIDLNLNSIKDLKKLFLEIYNKEGLLTKDKFLSQLDVRINECINFPGRWIINNAFYLLQDPEVLKSIGIFDVGRIYLQVRFLEKNQVEDDYLPEITQYFKDLLNNEVSFKGIFRINLIHCKDLPKADILTGKSDPYIEFSLKTPQKTFKQKSKIIKNNLNPIFNEFIDINIENLKDSQIKDSKLIIKVFDNDTGSFDELLGHIIIDNLEDIFYNKDKWSLNKIFDLKTESIQQKSQIYFQIIFFDEVYDNNLPPLQEDLQQSLSSVQKNGILFINLLHAKGLPKINFKENSINSYVEIKVQGLKENFKFESKVIKDSICPQYNEFFNKNVKIQDFRTFEKITIKLFNKNIIKKDELIGNYTINKEFFEKLFVNKKNEWSFNEIIQLQNQQGLKNIFTNCYGYLYLKIGFLDENSEFSELQQDIQNEDYKIIQPLSNIKGKIKIFVSHGKGLIGKDENGIGLFKKTKMDKKTSDPYMILYLNDQQNKLQTKVQKKTLNPIWQEEICFDNYQLDQFNPGQLKIVLKDKDNFLNQDDTLGYALIDIKEVVDKKNQWCINKYYDIIGKESDQKKFNSFGQIYLQIGFEQNDHCLQERPQIFENLELLKQISNIEFIMKIYIYQVFNIPIKNNSKCISKYYIKITCPNSEKIKSKIVQNQYHPIFNQELSLKINMNPNSLQNIKFLLYEDISFGKDILLGEISIDEKQFNENLNSWYFNDRLNLLNQNNIENKIQLFCSIGFFENEQNIIPIENTQKFQNTNQIQGQLIVKIVKILDADPQDGKTSDLFCQLKLGNQKYQTKTHKNKNSCDVNEVFMTEINEDYEVLVEKLKIQVYDQDLIKNDFIGEYDMNLNKIIQNQNTWQVNEIIELKNKEKITSKIYLQIKFQEILKKYNSIEEITNFPEINENLIQYENQKKFGKIIVAIIHGKDLIIQDEKTSDPYIKLELNTIKRQSKTIKKNCNPIFKEIFDFPIQLQNENELNKLLINIYDSDIGFDDEMGMLEIDIKNVFDKEQEWMIDEIFPIQPTKKIMNKFNNFGFLYLKCMYTKNLDYIPEIGELKENIEQIIENQKINGTLMINLIHAKQLLRADIQGSSDPYVKFQFQNQKILKSKAIQNNLYPEWNQLLKIDINNQNKKDWQFMNVYMMDEDVIKDEIIGKLKIDISEIFENQNFLNKVFPLQFADEKLKISSKKENAGQIYLQMKFNNSGQNDDFSKCPKIDKIENEFLQGKIIVNLVQAEQILNRDEGKDLSDPFVYIKIQGKQKFKKQKSKTINDCLNPQWNERFEFVCDQIPKFDIYSLFIQIQDYDKWGRNDDLGELNIYLDEIFEKKNQWSIGGKFEIQNQELKQKFSVSSLGAIELYVMFLEEGQQEPQYNEIKQFYKFQQFLMKNELTEDFIKKECQVYDLRLLTQLKFQFPIKNMLFIEKIPNLRFLDLSNCQLSIVHPLQQLKFLISLDLSQNQLWSIQGLQNQFTLQVLKLEGNNLEDLKNITYLKNLENLKILSFQSINQKSTNRICQNSNYQQEIDNNLPQLQSLDYFSTQKQQQKQNENSDQNIEYTLYQNIDFLEKQKFQILKEIKKQKNNKEETQKLINSCIEKNNDVTDDIQELQNISENLLKEIKSYIQLIKKINPIKKKNYAINKIHKIEIILSKIFQLKKKETSHKND